VRASPKLIAAFALLQVSLFLGSAVYRITPFAWEAWFDFDLTALQRGIFIAWALMNTYTEGYRGFHQRFCPRVVARAFELGRDPRPLALLLALPYSLSLIMAPKKQLLARWGFVVALYTLIVVVHQVSQPWRGIIDGGVVVGLVWGVVSLWWLFIRALVSDTTPPAVDATPAT
jgi:hypothetical protein